MTQRKSVNEKILKCSLGEEYRKSVRRDKANKEVMERIGEEGALIGLRALNQ